MGGNPGFHDDIYLQGGTDDTLIGNVGDRLKTTTIAPDISHSNDSALTQGVPIMGQRDDISTGSVTENNVSTVRITPGRALHTRPLTSPQFRVDYATPAQAISGATYVQAYLYSGSGVLHGFVFHANQDGIQLKLAVDGTTIFQDIAGSQLNSLGLTASNQVGGGYFLSRIASGNIAFIPQDPMPFGSSVQVSAKRDNAGSVTINTYLVYITKET